MKPETNLEKKKKVSIKAFKNKYFLKSLCEDVLESLINDSSVEPSACHF